MRNLTGPLIHPDGAVLANATLKVRAARVNWSAAGLVAHSMEQEFSTDQNGDFVMSLANGDYQVWLVMDEGGEQRLGPIVVEDGATIELGELLELSRDKSADYSISADWATKAYVTAQITLGAQPYDVDIDDLNPGDGAAGQLFRVTANGLNVEPFTPTLNHWPLGIGTTNGLCYLAATGKIDTVPVPRKVSANAVLAIGESLVIDMNAAVGPVEITVPTAWAVSQLRNAIDIISDEYYLAHQVTLKRPDGDMTINGIADDIAINRRRPVTLFVEGPNQWRFT